MHGQYGVATFFCLRLFSLPSVCRPISVLRCFRCLTRTSAPRFTCGLIHCSDLDCCRSRCSSGGSCGREFGQEGCVYESPSWSAILIVHQLKDFPAGLFQEYYSGVRFIPLECLGRQTLFVGPKLFQLVRKLRISRRHSCSCVALKFVHVVRENSFQLRGIFHFPAVPVQFMRRA